ncbi:nucleotidyltransferase domain-containing protein [archaeon]|nr:nucleotidyltransferase domain-containing protein [archaeon]
MVQLNELLLIIGRRDFQSFLTILSVFSLNHSKSFYKEQLVNKTGLAKATVNAAVDQLFQQGFLSKTSAGRTILYKLEFYNPVVRQLKVFLSVCKLYSIFKDFDGSEVYLFGSYARGEDVQDSDVDLLFVGHAPINKLRVKCAEVEDQFERKVSLIVKSTQEFSVLGQDERSRAFYENLIRNSIKVNSWTS